MLLTSEAVNSGQRAVNSERSFHPIFVGSVYSGRLQTWFIAEEGRLLTLKAS
jgi:hypothetical protein